MKAFRNNPGAAGPSAEPPPRCTRYASMNFAARRFYARGVNGSRRRGGRGRGWFADGLALARSRGAAVRQPEALSGLLRQRMKELPPCLLSAELQGGRQLGFLHLLSTRGQRSGDASERGLVVSEPARDRQHRFD